MSEQTLEPNTDIRSIAASNLAFLMSVIRCGEQLSPDEETVIRTTMKRLDDAVDPTINQSIAIVEQYRDEAQDRISSYDAASDTAKNLFTMAATCNELLARLRAAQPAPTGRVHYLLSVVKEDLKRLAQPNSTATGVAAIEDALVHVGMLEQALASSRRAAQPEPQPTVNQALDTVKRLREACEKRRDRYFNYVQLDIRDVLELCDILEALAPESDKYEIVGLDCAMCGAPKSFVISPLDPAVGYCFKEQAAWRVKALAPERAEKEK